MTTGAGNPGKYMAAWKAAGITVIPVVAAAVLARHLAPLDVYKRQVSHRESTMAIADRIYRVKDGRMAEI